MLVDRDLETAVVEIRQCVNEVVEIHPRGQAVRFEEIVTGWDADEENFLTRDVNTFAEQVREEFWQPWTTREDELSRPDLRAGRSSQVAVGIFTNRSGN